MSRSVTHHAEAQLRDRPCWKLGGVFTLLFSLLICGCHSGSDQPVPGNAARDGKPEAGPLQTAPDPQRTPAPIEKAVELPEPSNGMPFVAVASCEPRKLAAGDTFDLVIRARTLSGWHIYAVDQPTGVSVPTALELVLPPGVVAAGDWQYPEAEVHASEVGATFVYHGEMAFARKLRLTGGVTDQVRDIVCRLRFQACNAFSCLPPTTIELTATVETDSHATR